MSDTLSAEAELILSVDKFISNGRSAAEVLRALGSVVSHVQENVAGLDKELDAAQRGLAGTKKATESTSKSTAEGSKQWQQYVKDLKEAAAANQKFQQGQVTGEGGGTSAASLSAGTKSKLLATADAQGANVIRDLRAEQSAVEAVGQARLKANAQAYAAEEKTRLASLNSGQKDSHVQAYEARNRALETTSKQTALYNQYLFDEEKASQKAAGAANDHATSLISTRYALYDVATTYGILSTALLGVAAMGVKSGADFESAFSGVERTTLDAAGNSAANIDGIRESLVDLSTEMPVAFDEIARIATLGAQLGVPAKELANFSEVVAKFSAVTGMTADATAQAFGRLSNLLGIPIAQAEQLGSAIARVGVDSASTEQEIVALAQRLSATATRAGFTADQIIGLSGALGSLGVAPERAQGVFETYFDSLATAITEGGDKLEYFAQITGLTTDAVEQMVRSGDGFTVFQKFLSGLQGADTVDLNAGLDALGLSGMRANEVVGRIAGNLPLLRGAFDDAAQGFADGTELNNQYIKVVEDLNSQLAILQNSIQAFAAGGTGDLIPGLASAVGGLADMVNWARELSASGFGQTVFRFGATLTVVVGVIFAYRSAIALATASTYALTTANQALAAQGTRGGLLGLIGAVNGLSKSNKLGRTAALEAAGANEVLGKSGVVAGAGATVGATGLARFAGALKMVGRATIILAVLQLATELVFNFGESAVKVAGMWVGAEKYISGALTAIANNARKLSPILGGVADLIDGFAGAGTDNAAAFSKWADTLVEAEDGAASLDTGLGDLGIGLEGTTGNISDLSGATDALAAKVVTLADYASDLGGVMSRAFDIRFGGAQGADAIATGWNDIAKATADANQQIAEYQQTINELTADRKVLQYFKSVADKYGDTLRGGTLAASLEKNQNDLNKTTGDLSSAQLANSKTLSGNSSEAIANRTQILGLVTTYQGYLAALASSGMSQQDLAAKSVALKAEFAAQATQAGYSAAEIGTYSAAFDGMTTAINGVPRNITVDGNTDPAMQALAEFLAAAANSSADVPITASGAGAAGGAAGAEFAASFQDALGFGLGTAADGTAGRGLGFMSKTGSGRKTLAGGFEDGGYTGDLGTSKVAGAVHGKEFVFSAPATKAIGADKLAYLHKVAKSGRGYKDGGYVGNGGGSGLGLGGPTDLSAGSIMAIAEAVRGINVNLYTDDRKIAESANRGQVQLTNGGVS